MGVNAFYNPTAAKKIKALIEYLPLWTGVMRPYFKTGTEVATSSSVESLFAEYKTRLFKGYIPMRVDKFVASHLDYLDGRLRLDYAANASLTGSEFKTSPKQDQIYMHESNEHSDISNNSVTSNSYNNEVTNKSVTSISDTNEITDNSVTNNLNSTDDSHNIQAYSRESNSLVSISNDTSGSIANDSLNYQENWMGLINKDKKSGNIKKKSYLDKCPEWESVESTDTVFIPIMKNGNLCQPVKLRGETVMVRNTCAFDALLHITAHMIGMDADYKYHTQDIDDGFLQLAKKIVSQGKITRNEYIARASFLINLSLFEQYKYTRRFQSLDVMCNAAHLAEYTFLSLPSVHRIKKCKSCDYSNERNFVTLSTNVNVILQKGLEYIQEAVNDAITPKQCCVKCNNLCDKTEEYGPQIIIDTSILTDTNYLKNIGLKATTYNLDNISKNISVGSNKYILRGVVHYMDRARHYTAVVFTNMFWYEYDDLQSKRIQVSPKKYTVMPHVLLYTKIKQRDNQLKNRE